MVTRITGTVRRLAVLALVVSLLSPAGMGAVAASSDDGSVSYVRTVEEIRGHMELGATQFEDGNREAAVEHTTEVVDELGPVVVTEVSKTNETLASELEASFQAAHDAARNDSASAYATVLESEVLPRLEQAESAVVSEEELTNTTFNAKVVAGLLERAGAEYEEGVSESGEVTEEMDYWAAQAYADQAAARYEERIEGDVSEHAAEELGEMFESLDTSIESQAPPEDVSSMTGSITHELAEYTGLEVEASGDGAEVIERIEGDLHEAVEAYEAGNGDEARSIIKQTYLSNFEGIEGTLIENDPDLVEELEADFNEDLPGLIEEEASVSEVREEVESMESKLHEAEEILAAQDEEDIDLGTGDEQTTTTEQPDESTESTTSTETPGFGLLAAVVALGLIAIARYRTHE